MPPLTTPRLTVREFARDDWRAVHEYSSDAEVVRDMPFGPNTEVQTKDFLAGAIASQGVKPRTTWQLAIILREENRLVGAARLSVQNAERREADLGYIVHRAWWKRGIATEAARAVLGFGLGELKLHRIWATCDAGNPASARVLEKLGMRREGTMKEHMFVKGRWRDSHLYAILDREWNAIAGA